MTDLPAPPPPRDPDDIASDVVDGLLSPAEAELAQRDPVVAQRVQAILQVRAALRSTPPLDPAAADRAITAAIDAAALPAEPLPSPHPPLRTVPGTGGPGASPPPVRPAQPSGGHPRSARPWLAAAAAVLVGLVTVGVLASRNESTDSDATAARVETSEESGAEGEAPADDTSADRAPQATTSDEESAGAGADGQAGAATEPAVLPLGEVADADELATRVASAMTGTLEVPAPTADPAAPSRSDVDDCPGLSAAGDPARGTTVFTADATLDGTPVRVHVYQVGDQQRLVATSPSCVDVVDDPFDG